MNIKNSKEVDATALKRFEEIEWKKADQEHYGKNPPSFEIKNIRL